MTENIQVIMSSTEPIHFKIYEAEPIQLKITESVLSAESLALLEIFNPPEGKKKPTKIYIDGRKLTYQWEGE